MSHWQIFPEHFLNHKELATYHLRAWLLSKSNSNRTVIPGRNPCFKAVSEPLTRACGVGQKTLVQVHGIAKYMAEAFTGPCKINTVYFNGFVQNFKTRGI